MKPGPLRGADPTCVHSECFLLADAESALCSGLLRGSAAGTPRTDLVGAGPPGLSFTLTCVCFSSDLNKHEQTTLTINCVSDCAALQL